MRPINLDDANFDNEILRFQGPAIVFCEIAWTGSMHIMSAIVDSLTKKYSDMIKFARVEIPRSRTLSMTYSLSDFAVLFFKDGKLVEIKTGVISEDEIETCVRKVLEDKHPSS